MNKKRTCISDNHFRKSFHREIFGGEKSLKNDREKESTVEKKIIRRVFRAVTVRKKAVKVVPFESI